MDAERGGGRLRRTAKERWRLFRHPFRRRRLVVVVVGGGGVSAIVHLLADSLVGAESARRFHDSLAAPGAATAGAYGISMKTSAALSAHSPAPYPLEEAGMTRCIRQLIFLAGVEPGIFQGADVALLAAPRKVSVNLKGAIASYRSSV